MYDIDSVDRFIQPLLSLEESRYEIEVNLVNVNFNLID